VTCAFFATYFIGYLPRATLSSDRDDCSHCDRNNKRRPAKFSTITSFLFHSQIGVRRRLPLGVNVLFPEPLFLLLWCGSSSEAERERRSARDLVAWRVRDMR
ncbi:unnamed protein product, partial [Ectocarpus sp. 12 AP-2014]